MPIFICALYLLLLEVILRIAPGGVSAREKAPEAAVSHILLRDLYRGYRNKSGRVGGTYVVETCVPVHLIYLLYWPFIGKVLPDSEHYFRILKIMSVFIVLFMFFKFFYCSQDIYKFVLKLF
jgi:hypothetical protein